MPENSNLIEVLTKHDNEYGVTLDEYIIRFFGSEEEARKKMHLYALETDTEFETKTEDGVVKYEATVEYFLRLKTSEELAADQENSESDLVDDMWKPEDER